MSFNLDNYEPVADRLDRFWKDHPAGRVITDMVSHVENVVTFRASVWFDESNERPTATGWASEVEGGRGVNQTSALENCETSAIGRALANCNYAPKAARPSREEMGKATREPVWDPIEQDVLRAGWEAEIADAADMDAIKAIGKKLLTAKQSRELSPNTYQHLVKAGAARKAELNGAEVSRVEQPALS